MKKFVGLLLVLALTLCACCAWAEAVEIDFDKLANWKTQDYPDYPTDWKWYSGYKKLEIRQPGTYTIKNLNDGAKTLDAYIEVQSTVTDEVTLNLVNVKLSGKGIIGSSALECSGTGTLNVKLNKDTVLSAEEAPAIGLNEMVGGGHIVMNVSGEGSITDGGISVYAISGNGNYDVTLNISGVRIEDNAAAVAVTADGSVKVNVTGGAVLEAGAGGVVVTSGTDSGVVTLGDNVTVQGGERYGAVKISGNNGKLNIDGETHQGLMLLAGENLTKAKQIGIYKSHEDVYGNSDVKNAKYIATRTAHAGGVAGDAESAPMYEQTADLPQTGDSSSLALWGALLALAGAGMMARRKREA